MVYGQMNEPPGNRLRVALTGLTMAEYFRDEKDENGKGKDVLLFVDNIYRYTLPVPKCRHCWAVCRPRWVTSRPWPRKWASCRSASPRPRTARSPRSGPSTFPRTT